MGNNDNRVITWEALNSFITLNGGSPKKSSGANSLALKYGEFSEYAPMATSTSSGVVISDYTGIGGGAYTSNQLVIEKDVTWFTYVRPVPTGITVSPKSTTLDVGTAPEYPTFIQHTATVTAAADADKTVTWSISDPTKANIDQTGKVTAIAEGTVTVTATTVNGLSDTATVIIVRNDAPVIINPTNISIIASPDATIYVGDTTQCTATITPADTTDKTVTWSSASTSVATVNASGLVTGVSVGTAVITATSNADNRVKGTITITVIERPPVVINPTSITVSPDATLNPGQTHQLTVTVLPANATDKSVTWSSEDNTIATVDQNGLVTAIAVGQPVKIYATSNADPNVKGYATITVEAAPVNNYTISWSGDHVSVRNATSPVILEEGTSWRGTFVPDDGYEIHDISSVGSNVTISGNMVIIYDLQSDVTITATASRIQHSITWSGEHITTSNMNPTISNGGKLDHGSSWTCTFAPTEGYQIDNITCSDNNALKNGNTITINNLTSDVTITVTTSELIPTYTIGWSGSHAKINNQTSGSISKDRGQNWSGTVVPDTGYQIDSITATGSDGITKDGNNISITGITGNVTISWSASQIPVKSISVNPSTIELQENQAERLTATCENVNISDLAWSIEDSTIAQVDPIPNSKDIAWLAGVAGGSTKGRVYDSTDPSVYAEFTVTVIAKPILDPNDIAGGENPRVQFDEYGHYYVNNFIDSTHVHKSNNDMNIEIPLDWLTHEKARSVVIDGGDINSWYTATMRYDDTPEDGHTYLCINCSRFQDAIDNYNSLGGVITSHTDRSANGNVTRDSAITLKSTIDNSTIVIHIYQPMFVYGIKISTANEDTFFFEVRPRWACTSIDWYGVNGIEITNTEQQGHENEVGAASITDNGQSITAQSFEEENVTKWYAVAHFVDLPDVIWGAYPLAGATLKHTQS